MKYCDRCHGIYPTEFNTCPKDRGALRSTSELEAGMVLRGKYEVVEKIGSGGMAVVYRVRHLHLQEDVALKVVNSWVAADQDFLERFKTEAVVTRKLRHANAVRVDDFDMTEDGRPFIVMEYVRGQSLREVLKKHGLLSPSVAADIARQAALALGAAHELGIVHRDIKPENILLVPQPDGNDVVKVLDFGIAKITKASFDAAAGHTPTQTGLVLGTPQYVSPEQARAKRGHAQVDGRADLYSLGVVLYEMLAGRIPFLAESPFELLLQHLETPPTPLHLANPAINVSPAMSAVVMKALEKDPGKRFQSAAEMVAALSDPEVSVSTQPNAQVFSTEALAAAAEAIEEKPAGGAVVTHTPAVTVAVNPAPNPEPGARTEAIGTNMSDRGSHLTSAHPGAGPAQPAPPRRTRWLIPVAIGVALAAIIWLGMSFRHSSPPVATVETTTPSAVEKSTAVKPRRPAIARRRPSVQSAAAPQNATLQHLRAQELIATGYRRMQQKDFVAAREAFEQALEIEPGNPAAEKGMQAAQTAQTVQGIADVFKN